MLSTKDRTGLQGAYASLPTHENDGHKIPQQTIVDHESDSWVYFFLRSVPVFLAGCFIGIMAVKLTTLDLTRTKPAPGTWVAVSQLPLHSVTFMMNDTFSAGPSPESDAAWASLDDERDNYILQPPTEDYGLPPGMPHPSGGQIYGVSMYHQLHCLQYLRHNLFPLLSAPSPAPEDSPFAGLFIPPIADRVRHAGHCFDFLRQSILCCGDMTLGWASNNTEFVERPHIDGWGVTHRECKDWTQVLPYLREHDARKNRTAETD